MKSRQNSREKETIFKKKTTQQIFQSARDHENSHKLANLLNLSQVNLNINNNSNKDATFFSINSKINQNRKNPVMLNDSSANNQNINHTKNNNINLQTYLNNGDVGQQQQSEKQIKSTKSRRSKSTRRHLLSCHQILNISKKRDTCSLIPFQSSKNNPILHYGSTKTKKKTKKQIPLIKIQNSLKVKNNQNCSLNQSKIVNHNHKIQENTSNFVANYPLSMSHSYIVFSQKDSSLNNTANILSKMSRKLSISNEAKMTDLQDKLELIKIQHAVVIIQKNWRGYLTRKLLQDYIQNQQHELNNKLKDIRLKNQQADHANNSLLKNPYKNNNDESHSSISQIFESGQGDHYEQHQIDQKQYQQYIDSQKLSSVDQEDIALSNNKSIKNNNQQSMYFQSSYKKKQPIVNGYFQHEAFQSILKFEQSENITSRSKYFQKINKPEIDNKISHLLSKSINTEITSRNINKNTKPLSICQQISQIIAPKITENQQQELSANNLAKKLNQIVQQILVKFQDGINSSIQQYKKQISQRVKKSQISFQDMLKIRQKVKNINNEMICQINSISTNIKTSIYKLTLIQKNKNNTNNQHNDNINLQSPNKIIKIKKQNSDEMQNSKNNKNIQQNNQKAIKDENIYIGSYFNSSKNSQQNKQEYEQNNINTANSPVSEYFTIQLPTQQLSPHKNNKMTTGLDSLKTYLQNLSRQCQQDQNQNSQTSFLCSILKKHSELGPQNMIQRCLIQMLVEMLTGQFLIQDLLLAIDQIANNHQQLQQMSLSGLNNLSIDFVKKWAEQLDKWELGPIQQVSCNMEQSENITQRNSNSKKKKKYRRNNQLCDQQ